MHHVILQTRQDQRRGAGGALPRAAEQQGPPTLRLDGQHPLRGRLPDLKTAKIRYSVYGGDTEEAIAGIENAAGYFRRELARRLNLRITPELTFLRDDSIAHGARIAQLLREVLPEQEEPAANGRKSEENDG